MYFFIQKASSTLAQVEQVITRVCVCVCVQVCQQAGDHQGVPQGGAEVAPRQLPRRRQEARGEEVHRRRRRQGGTHRTLSLSRSLALPPCTVDRGLFYYSLLF